MHDIIVEYARTRPPYVLRKWRYRGHVPHQHRLPILMAAAKRGVSLKESDFVFTDSKAKPAKRARKRKAA